MEPSHICEILGFISKGTLRSSLKLDTHPDGPYMHSAASEQDASRFSRFGALTNKLKFYKFYIEIEGQEDCLSMYMVSDYLLTYLLDYFTELKSPKSRIKSLKWRCLF